MKKLFLLSFILGISAEFQLQAMVSQKESETETSSGEFPNIKQHEIEEIKERLSQIFNPIASLKFNPLTVKRMFENIKWNLSNKIKQWTGENQLHSEFNKIIFSYYTILQIIYAKYGDNNPFIPSSTDENQFTIDKLIALNSHIEKLQNISNNLLNHVQAMKEEGIFNPTNNNKIIIANLLIDILNDIIPIFQQKAQELAYQ